MFDIGNLLSRLLGGIVDGFKVKNPLVFTIITGFLLTVYFALNWLITAVTPEGAEILGEQGSGVVATIQNVLVFILALLGAHTPQAAKSGVQKARDDLGSAAPTR